MIQTKNHNGPPLFVLHKPVSRRSLMWTNLHCSYKNTGQNRMAVKHTGPGLATVVPPIGSANDRYIFLYNFDVDSPRLKQEHKAFLKTHVVPLLFQGGRITIKGMSSRPGSEKRNSELSLERAHGVRDYLVVASISGKSEYIYLAEGAGEKPAKKSGQANDVEDSRYRSVFLVVSPNDRVPQWPDIPMLPKPEPDWRFCRFSAEVNYLDIKVAKKMSGKLYLADDDCSDYIQWDLSLSGLHVTGPGPALGKFHARAQHGFWYDWRTIDPFFSWRDKTVYVRLVFSKIALTVVNALPQPATTEYHPFKGPGIKTTNRNVIIEMAINPGQPGGCAGVGSIKDPTKRHRKCSIEPPMYA